MSKNVYLPGPVAIIFLLIPLFTFSQSSRYPPKEEDGKWGIWNDYNNKCWLYDPVYDLVEQFDGYYKTYIGDSVGLITNNYIVPLEPQFEDVYYENSTNLIAVKKNGKWGRINEKREVLIDYDYEELRSIGKFLLKFSEGQKYGLIDYWGNEIAPAEFEEISFNQKDNPYRENILTVHKDKKIGILDQKGNFWLPCQFEKVTPSLFISERLSKPTLFPVSKDNKWGFANGKGELIIPFTYPEVSPFHKGVAIVAFEQGTYGLINEKGEEITNQKYSEINGFDPINDVSQVKDKDKGIGLIAINGREVLAPGANKIKPVYENPVLVAAREREQQKRRGGRVRNGARGITMKGLPKGQIHILSDELAHGLYNYTFRESPVKELPKKMPRRLTGLISADGDINIPPSTHSTYKTFRYGILNASSDLSLINQKELFLEKFDITRHYYKNYFIVGREHQYGIYDALGKKLIIPLEYNDIKDVRGSSSYSHKNHQTEYFVVGRNNKTGLINKSNQILIPLAYSRLEVFSNYGVAIVRKSKKLPNLTEGNRTIAGRKEHKFALFSLKGDQLTEFEYDRIHSFNDDIAGVVKDGKSGFINSKGEEFIPCGKYQKIKRFHLYSKESGIHEDNQLSNKSNNLELPDSLFLMTFFSQDTIKYLVDLNGDIVDSVSVEESKDSESAGKWLKEMVFRNGKYELKHRKPFGQSQYGKEIDPAMLTQFSKKTGGFHPIRHNSAIANGYYLQQTDKTILFDEVEIRGDSLVPIRWVKMGKYYGFINNLGDPVTPMHFEKVSKISDGLICVVKDRKVGYLNQDGVEVIPFEFDDDYNKIPQFNFENGKAIAMLNEKYGIINKKGEAIVPFQFDGIIYYDGLEVIGVTNGRWRRIKI